ncbi:hypothetical protein Sme01_49550 [Sphaerisporangium melleum]|uniref:DUF4276 family protein n=1 Tax=Sphaerisporangium melleum TaxID=321316 RepID=A0A917VK13_9ACTN|nr:hypothetical protein [Sphaerisporangium melleum]GGK89286.1 hypothetical protein GCM10007964_34950 [Sphaerisporangium melleum]GII72479.1 hypothetical protein Sme01_49550 [Sphaerisporangium melleum]
MTKRDVVFLVADAGMEQMLRGFLGRPQVHRSVRCGPFAFDPREDLFVAPTKDPGVYNTARELLRPFETLHRRAVVMLDAAWDGSPGAEAIHKHIEQCLEGAWEQFAVVVIDPELEAWVWQDNVNVAQALKCTPDFRRVLADSGHWPHDRLKPPDPKAALEHLRRRHKADGSKAAFRRLAEKVSVRHCQDPAFNHLCQHLRAWFPENS